MKYRASLINSGFIEQPVSYLSSFRDCVLYGKSKGKSAPEVELN